MAADLPCCSGEEWRPASSPRPAAIRARRDGGGAPLFCGGVERERKGKIYPQSEHQACVWRRITVSDYFINWHAWFKSSVDKHQLDFRVRDYAEEEMSFGALARSKGNGFSLVIFFHHQYIDRHKGPRSKVSDICPVPGAHFRHRLPGPSKRADQSSICQVSGLWHHWPVGHSRLEWETRRKTERKALRAASRALETNVSKLSDRFICQTWVSFFFSPFDLRAKIRNGEEHNHLRGYGGRWGTANTLLRRAQVGNHHLEAHVLENAVSALCQRAPWRGAQRQRWQIIDD